MISKSEPLPIISLQELSENVPYVVQAFLPQLGLVFAPEGAMEADFGALILDELRQKAGLLGDYNLVGVGIKQVSDTVYTYTVLYVKQGEWADKKLELLLLILR